MYECSSTNKLRGGRLKKSVNVQKVGCKNQECIGAEVFYWPL